MRSLRHDRRGRPSGRRVNAMNILAFFPLGAGSKRQRRSIRAFARFSNARRCLKLAKPRKSGFLAWSDSLPRLPGMPKTFSLFFAIPHGGLNVSVSRLGLCRSGCSVDWRKQESRRSASKLDTRRRFSRRRSTKVPDKLVTDDLRSYAAAAGHLGIAKRHERGQWRNNRAENSHQPTRRRERKMLRFKSPGSAQKFLSTHAAAYNTFNVQRHLTSAKTHRAFRATAMQTWRDVVDAA